MITHYPDTKEGKDRLSRKVTDIHMETICKYINDLPCPLYQKLDLIDMIRDAIR